MEYGYYKDGHPQNSIWPKLIPNDELCMRTASVLKEFLQNNNDIENRNNYIDILNMIPHALTSFDTRHECCSIACIFFRKYHSKLNDPFLAFQWCAHWRMRVPDDESATIALIKLNMGLQLVAFGTIEQKVSAVQAMEEVASIMFAVNLIVDHEGIEGYIKVLAGIYPLKACKKPEYDLSPIVNIERARELYLRMLAILVAENNSYVKEKVAEFEPLLGVQYYQEMKKIAEESKPQKTNDESTGCYIATCVYGSYDCPQVWTLRRFRDDFLAEHAFGRGFIRCYYAIAPYLVKIFGDCSPVRSFWKLLLDRMVGTLNKKGYQDTPYED